MSTEEKLQKAIEFIKKIEKMNLPTVEVGDIIHIEDGECEDCGSSDVNCHIVNDDMEVILPNEIDELKDKAWHLLIDIDGL